MISFLKSSVKFIIGIAVLILVVLVFACSMKSADSLELSTLEQWKRAPLERRIAAAKIVVASDANIDLLVQCVDKMATLEDSGEMMISDAVALCHTGIQLKENL